jgi:opacity protein-like surface antigen
MKKQLFPSRAATSHAAFAGTAGLQVKYQLTSGLAVKVGYEALWLGGVALAPGQIQETLTSPTSVTALGVNCRSNALFQGGAVGLEYSF